MAKRIARGRKTAKSRDAPREPLLDAGEKAKTPEWIMKRYPDAPKELPKDAIEEFNAYFEKAAELAERYEKGLFNMEKINDRLAHGRAKIYAERAEEENRGVKEVLEEAFIFTDFMNNFSYNIFSRSNFYSEEEMGQKFGNTRNAAGYEASELLKNQTRKEFYDTVLKIIDECGLSYEDAEGMFKGGGNSANRYLFPVLLKLLEMGYKRYPDLTI